MDKLPHSVDELIGALDQFIPEQRPFPGQTLEAVMWESGRRSVVNDLKALLEQARNPQRFDDPEDF